MLSQIKLSIFLASRPILRGDKSSLMLVIIVMVVVFLNLLFTDAIFSGITKAMNNVKITNEYGEVMIEPKPGEQYITDTRDIIDLLRNDPAVLRVSPILQTGATYVNKKRADGRDEKRMTQMLQGIETDNMPFDYESKVIAGRFLGENDFGKIVIGKNLSGGYGANVFPTDLGKLKPGDKIDVYYSGVKREFEVIGILGTKDFTIDAFGFVLKKDLSSVLHTTDEASRIIIRLNKREDSKRIMQKLINAGYGDYDIADWEEKIAFAASINKSFEVIGSTLRVIGAILAGLIVFIVIFVDILNKRRQIGIFKAIGVPDKVIILSYVWRGLFYAILGISFGYLLMRFGVIGAFSAHPIKMPMADVIPVITNKALLSSVIFFTFSGLIGSLIPAFKEIRKKVLILLYH